MATFYPGGQLRKQLDDLGILVISLEKKSRWDLWGFLLRLFRLVNELRPTVVHAYLGTANILAALLKLLIPEIHVVWGVRASNMELQQYGWLDRLLFAIECRLSRFADLIIVNSKAGRDYADGQGFSTERMVVIPNGIDTERFSPNVDLRQSLRDEWEVGKEQTLVGMVGRLDPMKDHETFIRAAALFSVGQGDVRFVCVGHGPEAYRDHLATVAKWLNADRAIIWAGPRDDMTTVYNAMDVVVSSSSFGEGFPNVIGEAMACGVPCVVTDVGDAKDIVGETGMVVPPKDPAALASAMQTMVDAGFEARRALGRKARERIVEKFGVDRMVEETARVLLSLR